MSRIELRAVSIAVFLIAPLACGSARDTAPPTPSASTGDQDAADEGTAAATSEAQTTTTPAPQDSSSSTDASASTSDSFEPTCGDGVLDTTEACDDGNAIIGDGCDDDCTPTAILDIQVGYYHACAVIEGGRVRCWGRNDVGQLGRANAETVGDDEVPAAVGDVALPWPVVQLTSSFEHNCARNANAELLCWGRSAHGELGYGNTEAIGDDELPSSLAAVDLGAASTQVIASQSHSCSIDASGSAKCWGWGTFGRLGYGNTVNIGDDETPAAVGSVPVGHQIEEMCPDAGAHTCAVLSDGGIKCWGFNNYGQLGYGHTDTIGDDESPAEQPTLTFDVPANHVACGLGHTCASFEDGSVRCWGHNNYGQLGRGDVLDVGDTSPVTALDPLPIEDPVVDITAGHRHTCVRHANGNIRCWGVNSHGQLGRGDFENVGDDEVASTFTPIDTGGQVVRVDAGGNNTCVVYDDQRVRCWGDNVHGQTGLGPAFPTDDGVGDDPDEQPSQLPYLQLLLEDE